MWAIVITVCSLLEGNTCGRPHQENPVWIAEQTTAIGCLIDSQIMSAQYVIDHPNHIVMRMTCQPADLQKL